MFELKEILSAVGGFVKITHEESAEKYGVLPTITMEAVTLFTTQRFLQAPLGNFYRGGKKIKQVFSRKKPTEKDIPNQVEVKVSASKDEVIFSLLKPENKMSCRTSLDSDYLSHSSVLERGIYDNDNKFSKKEKDRSKDTALSLL